MTRGVARAFTADYVHSIVCSLCTLQQYRSRVIKNVSRAASRAAFGYTNVLPRARAAQSYDTPTFDFCPSNVRRCRPMIHPPDSLYNPSDSQPARTRCRRVHGTPCSTSPSSLRLSSSSFDYLLRPAVAGALLSLIYRRISNQETLEAVLVNLVRWLARYLPTGRAC